MIILTTNKVKTNLCFSFNQTNSRHYRLYLCATVQTHATYITIVTAITIRSLFVICSQRLCKPHFKLFLSHDYSLFTSQPCCWFTCSTHLCVVGVVSGLPVTMVYLCNKLVMVVAVAFICCCLPLNDIRSFGNNTYMWAFIKGRGRVLII